MFKKSAILLLATMSLAACASSQPRVIQSSSSDSSEVRITMGMATQIEMPDQARVQTIVVGNPSLLTAEKDMDVVTLSAKEGTGETNLIIRARENDGDIKVYQYHVIVGNP